MSDLQINVKNAVQNILGRVFIDYSAKKRQVISYKNSLTFACPCCLDSHEDDSKKRGYLYWETGYYHCYICKTHITAISLFERFSEDIDIDLKDDLRKLISDYHLTTLLHNNSNVNLSSIQDLINFGVNKNHLFYILDLQPITETDELYQYLSDRLINHKLNILATNKARDRIYIFNQYGDNVILGYQIRHLTGTVKYMTYPIDKIYKDILFKDYTKITNHTSQLSLSFGFFNVDFSKPFTLFEGPIDSFFFKNSIGLTSAGTNTDFYDQLDTVRYFFDNDDAGKEKMIKKIKLNKAVFLWQKFIQNNKLENFVIKDINDIFVLSKKINRPLFKNLESYFSDNPLDIIYI